MMHVNETMESLGVDPQAFDESVVRGVNSIDPLTDDACE